LFAPHFGAPFATDQKAGRHQNETYAKAKAGQGGWRWTSLDGDAWDQIVCSHSRYWLWRWRCLSRRSG